MENLIERVILIDDDVNMNFYNEIIIKDTGICTDIIDFQNGKQALDYLKNEAESEYLKRTIIFLDINMPIMNGWDFIEEYTKLPENQKASAVVTMLTSSLNLDDLNRSKQYEDIKEYVNKPLQKEKVVEIVKKYVD